MLEYLFGSKTRVKLLSLFLSNPSQSFYIRELTRKFDLQINAIRRELANLEEMGIVKISKESKDKQTSGLEKKFYQVNNDFVLHSELKSLFIKSQLLVHQSLLSKLAQMNSVDYLVLTGFFVDRKAPWGTDMLIVGNVERNKLSRLLRSFEAELNHEINYTIMPLSEFKYRKDLADRFLYDILENKKIVVIDKIN